MAKIKFPLEMANGEQVRTLGDFKENFDIEKAVGYFLDGKLQTWLEDRYYEEEAEAVSSLDKEDTELSKKLCDIFGVEYVETQSVNAEEIVERNARIEKLKQFTDDEEVIKNIDFVAFNQEELGDLYDKGATKIYLCEGDFNIPKSKQGLEYVEIGDPTVIGLSRKKVEKTEEKRYNNFNCSAPIIIEPYRSFSVFDEKEHILIDTGDVQFFYKKHKIYKRQGENITEILKQYDFNYQKIIAKGDYIYFIHMVGNARGDYLKAYGIKDDEYWQVDSFVREFIINEDFMYYVKLSENSVEANQKVMRCKLDLSNIEELYDFGTPYKIIQNLKLVGNKLYYDYGNRWSDKESPMRYNITLNI